MQVGGSLAWLCLLLRWVCIEVFECFLNWDTANTKLEIKLRWLFECVSIVDFLHGWFFFGSESRDQTSFSGAVLPNQFFWGSVTKPEFLGQCSTGCNLHILGVRQRHRVGPWESPAWVMLKVCKAHLWATHQNTELCSKVATCNRGIVSPVCEGRLQTRASLRDREMHREFAWSGERFWDKTGQHPKPRQRYFCEGWQPQNSLLPLSSAHCERVHLQSGFWCRYQTEPYHNKLFAMGSRRTIWKYSWFCSHKELLCDLWRDPWFSASLVAESMACCDEFQQSQREPWHRLPCWLFSHLSSRRPDCVFLLRSWRCFDTEKPVWKKKRDNAFPRGWRCSHHGRTFPRRISAWCS